MFVLDRCKMDSGECVLNKHICVVEMSRIVRISIMGSCTVDFKTNRLM